MTMRRRDFTTGLGLAIGCAPWPSWADVMLREATVGEPGEEVEQIDLTIEDIARIENLTLGIVDGKRDTSFFPIVDKQKLFRNQLLKVAAEEADARISRASNPDRVTEYLNLFGLAFADPGTGKPYAYCACGISWSIAKAYCDLVYAMSPKLYKDLNYSKIGDLKVFAKVLKDIRKNYIRPHPQVEVIAEDARKRGIWVDASATPVAGWIVFYNWSGGTTGQHIGIVESASASSLHTIEFNTAVRAGNQINGGVVARKDRTADRKRVLGFARTY